MGAEQRRRGVGGENRPRQLWRRVQGSPPAQQPGRGRQDLQGDAAGRTKEEVPAGGPHTQAVRAPQHCPLHRDMCAEALLGEQLSMKSFLVFMIYASVCSTSTWTSTQSETNNFCETIQIC